ncbi:MAG: hypothetical protein DI586_04930 [Micavibrio aeruginosavorus]|uniref:Uncharacterized protein n=1 Tax=Micavibrio aeruginosavorus TaxID=349221 RepID=A0A2W5FM05_9BACT|nr:MAG: hypothetical protein DI586_04930 [Micavibrio aeruginosavorus]
MSNDSRPSPTAAIFKAAADHSIIAGIEAYAEIYQSYNTGRVLSKSEKHRMIVAEIDPQTPAEKQVIAIVRQDLGLQ